MTETTMTCTVKLRYFAGARSAAGVAEERLRLPGPATVADALAEAVRRRGSDGEALGRVLRACSFLLDGTAVRDHDAALPDSAELDVLPPFAGG